MILVSIEKVYSDTAYDPNGNAYDAVMVRYKFGTDGPFVLSFVRESFTETEAIEAIEREAERFAAVREHFTRSE